MTRKLSILAALGLALAVAGVVRATADEAKGQCRVYLFDGRQIDGEVKQLTDGSYEVKTKYGIVLKLKKQDVKRLQPLAETTDPQKIQSPGETSANAALLRRAITDEEIEELVAGIEAELIVDEGAVDLADLDAPLPYNEESVKEMLRMMGGAEKAKIMQWPHFVLVYTATDEAARKLGARLESVWRWNAKFVKRLNVVPRRPDSKLEIYFFATYQEFEAYSLNQGTSTEGGVLGYFAWNINRSHFFDLITWPPIEYKLHIADDPRQHPAERRRARNAANAWVEHNNLEVIQHECGHHIHFNTGVFPIPPAGTGDIAPRWLVEGATMMFEVPPAESGGAGLGELNDARLDQLRGLPRWTSFGLKSFMINNNEWFHDEAANYARGWSLVYYLWKKHRDGLGKFIRIINERPPGAQPTLTQIEQELESCFGRIDDKWLEKFYEYMDSLSVRQSRLPPPPW